jgi:uncharacterized repeat protein (TIGR01451 family)
MKTRSTRCADLFVSRRPLLFLPVLLMALITLAIVPFLTTSASTVKLIKPDTNSFNVSRSGHVISATSLFHPSEEVRKINGFLRFAVLDETIGTYAADCTTPKTDFYLGDTVCAKTAGVTATDRFVNWLTPANDVIFSSPTITQDPESFLYTIPNDSQYIGIWKATIADPSDSSINPAPFNVSAAPPIATYDGATCSIPTTDFTLTQTVCVKVYGVPVNTDFPNRIVWVNVAGYVERKADITTDPQSDLLTLPSADTQVINGETVDNRGVWRVYATRNNGRILLTSLFNVSDAANPAAHLVVSKYVADADTEVDAGSPVNFVITLANEGPDAATTVQLSDPTPSGLSLVNFTQTSGPTFACTGSDCTVASLAAGAKAEFLAEYNVVTGTAGGTVIGNTVVVSSPVSDPNGTQRSSTSAITVVNAGNQATCALQCPNDITVTANATQGGNDGAFVTFSSAEPIGDCGAVTANPASGSFFTVGSHSVSVSSATGGGSCSFLVTVLEDNPPTITCPLPDITATAPSGSFEANVTVTPPAATGTNVSVSGIRSDAQLVGDPPSFQPDLDDPYPAGTTIIRWTATEFIDGQPGRTASCNQKVIVTAPDAPTITCPSNKSFSTADCGSGKTLTASDIGSPTATGDNVQVEGTRSDSLHLYNDPYPVGTTAITWTATDSGGRVASCTQTITITASGDTENPVVTAPPNVVVSTNSCGQIVGETELGTPTASDNCSVVSISRSGVPSGNFFPTGTTTVTYTATDGAGNTGTATQTVTVQESPAINPTITAPGDLSFNTGPGATECGVVVGDATLGSATASDNCPGVTVTRTGVPAGNLFPVGPTTVTYTATDRAGNTASDTQIITVTDNTVPVVTAPAAVTLYTGPSATSCGVTVSDLDGTLGTGSATDNCPGVGAVSRSGVPAGNVFPLGDTVLTYSATDAHGNSASATQTVTVVDNTPPVLNDPADVVAYTGAGATTCSTVVSDATLGTATASDNCPGIGAIVRTGVPSGNVFPEGNTIITYTVTDAHNNTTQQTQKVTVIDNTAPVISCPSNIVLEPTCPSGAIATWTPPVGTDNCPGATTSRTAGGAPGSVFPIGTTTVTYTVNDAHGNSASCSFTVTVLTPQQVIQNMLASLSALSPPLTSQQRQGLAAKLTEALNAINQGKTNVACNKLNDFISQVTSYINNGTLTSAQGQPLIDSANHVRNTIGCTNLPCS